MIRRSAVICSIVARNLLSHAKLLQESVQLLLLGIWKLLPQTGFHQLPPPPAPASRNHVRIYRASLSGNTQPAWLAAPDPDFTGPAVTIIHTIHSWI